MWYSCYLLTQGQTKKSWHLRLIDDDVFEDMESFTLELSEPVMAVIEQPKVATVTIFDQEDGESSTSVIMIVDPSENVIMYLGLTGNG